MTVSQIMTKDPVACTPDTSVEEVARLMVTHDCGSIPVCEPGENKRVVGVVTDRDIVVRLVAAGRDPLRHRAADCMSRPVAVVHLDDDVHGAVKLMEENQVRRAPVVDGAGQLVGVVAQADIARSARPEDTAELVQQVSQSIDIGHDL